MARRKKEPKSVHRENIAAAASALFMEKGITATSMNDIAKAAGYSKATLYVYLSGLIQLAANKEEYIEKTINLSKIQFLEYGFDMLYHSIEKE